MTDLETTVSQRSEMVASSDHGNVGTGVRETTTEVATDTARTHNADPHRTAAGPSDSLRGPITISGFGCTPSSSRP